MLSSSSPSLPSPVFKKKTSAKSKDSDSSPDPGIDGYSSEIFCFTPASKEGKEVKVESKKPSKGSKVSSSVSPIVRMSKRSNVIAQRKNREAKANLSTKAQSLTKKTHVPSLPSVSYAEAVKSPARKKARPSALNDKVSCRITASRSPSSKVASISKPSSICKPPSNSVLPVSGPPCPKSPSYAEVAKSPPRRRKSAASVTRAKPQNSHAEGKTSKDLSLPPSIQRVAVSVAGKQKKKSKFWPSDMSSNSDDNSLLYDDGSFRLGYGKSKESNQDSLTIKKEKVADSIETNEKKRNNYHCSSKRINVGDIVSAMVGPKIGNSQARQRLYGTITASIANNVYKIVFEDRITRECKSRMIRKPKSEDEILPYKKLLADIVHGYSSSSVHSGSVSSDEAEPFRLKGKMDGCKNFDDPEKDVEPTVDQVITYNENSTQSTTIETKAPEDSKSKGSKSASHKNSSKSATSKKKSTNSKKKSSTSKKKPSKDQEAKKVGEQLPVMITITSNHKNIPRQIDEIYEQQFDSTKEEILRLAEEKHTYTVTSGKDSIPG